MTEQATRDEAAALAAAEGRVSTGSKSGAYTAESIQVLEGLVASTRDESVSSRPRRAISVDPDMQHMEARMREALGTKVTISPSSKGGRIAITWYDDDDLGRLVDALSSNDL